MERGDAGRRQKPSFAPSLIVFCYSYPGLAFSDTITHPVLGVNVTKGKGRKNTQTHACIYVCMCVHTYIYTHTHTYIYTHTLTLPGQKNKVIHSNISPPLAFFTVRICCGIVSISFCNVCFCIGNIGGMEHEKLEKYQELKEELEKMLSVKAAVVLIVT